LRIVDDVQVFAGRVRVPSALVVALALSACQTVVVRSHRDSSVGKLTFARSLAIVNFSSYVNSEPIRRAGEMELVNGLPNLNLVPSYRLFSLKELADLGEVKRRASAEGFDGLVLLWVKEARIERGGVSVALPEGFSLAEGGWVTVRVSAAVVSVAEDRELWNGVVERQDDEGKKKDVLAIVRAVVRQLRSDRLVD
jgi:hypothetical protein